MRMFAAVLLASVLMGTQASADQLQFSPNELISASNGFIRNERPRVEFTDDGRSHVVWARGLSFGAEGAFLASASVDGIYGDAVQISNALDGVLLEGGYGPTICRAGVYLAVGWENRNTSNSANWCAVSTNMGYDWEDPTRADPGTVELRDYQCVALFPDGRLSQTWAKYDAGYANPRYEWTRQNAEGTFDAPVEATALAGTVCECCSPYQIVLDDGQTVLLAFRRNLFNVRESHVVRSTDGGSTFSELHRVDTSGWFIQGCPSSGPHIAADGTTVIAAFMTAGSGDSHVYTARSTDSGASWEPMVQVDDEVTGATVNYVQVALRGDIAVAVFEGRNNSNSAVFAALSTDAGQTWGVPVVVSDVSGPLVRVPTVAISPSYVVEVVWRDNRDGAPRLYRSRASATVPSSVPTVLDVAGLYLAPLFPNPATERVTIPFSLPEDGGVRITVYDPRGREVTDILSRSFTAGEHQVDWSMRDREGNRVGPGVYWLRLEESTTGRVSSAPVHVVR